MGMRREGGGGVGRGMLKERKPQSTDKRITSNRDRANFPLRQGNQLRSRYCPGLFDKDN